MTRFFGDSNGIVWPHASCRKGSVVPSVLIALVGLCAIAAHLLVGTASNPRTAVPQKVDKGAPTTDMSGSVFIQKPSGPPRVNTGLQDPHGQPVTIACNTCHGNWTANTDARVSQKLERFHQHLHGNHGNLACVACHNSGDGYATLRLADGKSVPYPEVMQLCAQCHGPQFRDYQHGSHGGMAGYWDLNRGPRTRNNCIDCHQPHSPRYPRVQPARGPNDRFLSTGKGSGHE